MKDTSPDPASKARLRLWLRLLRVTRTIEGEVREKLRRAHDTTLPRFDVMAALHRVPEGLKMSELSGQLRVSNGNVTGIVDRLVQDGLVERLAVPGDRRAMQVRLTSDGRSSFSEMADIHEGWIDEMLGGLTGAEANQMAEALRRIATRLDERTSE
ncbi:MAG: MarR family winged helix-turn-helix transcriptional regulator [Paracoccaceae bacterium]